MSELHYTTERFARSDISAKWKKKKKKKKTTTASHTSDHKNKYYGP